MYIKRESTNLGQWRKIGLNILMLITLIVISLLRGKGDGYMTGIKKCSGVDWFLFFMLIGIAILLLAIAVWYLRYEYRDKVRIGYKFAPGEVKAEPKAILTISGVTLICGIAVGGLGLGAGLLLNPLLM